MNPINRTQIYYKEPVFRPPSEAYSLLIQATEGCTFRCTFCYPYLKKKFIIRKMEEIKHDINLGKKIYGNKVEKIFLLDGNAFVMKPSMLIEIAKYCYKIHPHLKRVSAYAHAKDVLRKSDEELKQIYEAGITMVYVGIETGDEVLLQRINKQVTPDELVAAAQKLHKSKIQLSGTVILGLAGSDNEKSKQHARKTAELINRMNLQPDQKGQQFYISALTLMIPPDTDIKKQKATGEFIPIDSIGVLHELKWIIEGISENLTGCVWRSNHASNYVALKGILAKDKPKLIKQIQYAIDNPSSLRPEHFRGL